MTFLGCCFEHRCSGLTLFVAVLVFKDLKRVFANVRPVWATQDHCAFGIGNVLRTSALFRRDPEPNFQFYPGTNAISSKCCHNRFIMITN